MSGDSAWTFEFEEPQQVIESDEAMPLGIFICDCTIFLRKAHVTSQSK